MGSYREQQRAWLQQFAQVEGGLPMSKGFPCTGDAVLCWAST